VRLFAFTVGWMTLNLSFFLAGENGQITFPATAYLIDHPKGMAVFDTGLGPRFLRPAGAPAPKWTDLEEDATIDARLRAIGVDPADIRWILSSHLHTDHAGGHIFLPNATVIVQAAEHDYAFNGGDRAYHQPEFDTGQTFKLVHGEYDVFGDGTVVLFPTPGHTPGHQSARVRTGRGNIVLASDCCNLKRSLDDLRLPDHCHDADLYLSTLKKLSAMRKQGSRIFYSHDPDFWKTVPQSVPLN
jgi:glyoxylase-like metal-dependent hydrolase (beta-lactamase superfamily II)